MTIVKHQNYRFYDAYLFKMLFHAFGSGSTTSYKPRTDLPVLRLKSHLNALNGM